MSARAWLRWMGLCLLALGACGDDDRPAPDAGEGDAGGEDAGRDAGIDAGSDAGFDAGFDAGPEPTPVFRNAVDLPDGELATAALRLMGAPEAGGSESCSTCHAITRQNIRHFWDLSDLAWRECFADLEVETAEAARAIVSCFEESPGVFRTANLGVFATGADFEWFGFVFRRAFGAEWEEPYERFRARVRQPPEDHPSFTQAEFDLLTEWFLRGTPRVENVLPALDGPGECTPYVDASVTRLVEEGERSGWSARNREAALLMHGCAGAASPTDCLSAYPLVAETPLGAELGLPAGAQHRALFEVPYRSSYWTKTSADGRFVAHGGNHEGAGASIIDLQRAVVIGAQAAYDPGFFPDGSGFMFQGTSRGPAVCMQNVLTTGSPTFIDFREEGCSRTGGIALYQHVGSSLDGADHWVVTSLWSGDTGESLRDPDVFVSPTASVTLYRLSNTAAGFDLAGSYEISTPWEGNAVISPTMRLMVTQLADAEGAPLGFVLRRIDITRIAGGEVTNIALPEVARYCVPGGKAAMSLDDRWIVTHHRASDEDAVELGFTGPDDPAFAPYRGVSNVYLVDVATGARTRITNVQPGQRALFPSFRSDGWIYYLVRVGGTGSVPEYVVATDAALGLR